MYIGYPSGMPQECRFIKSDGRRCHAMAMRGMAYCYFHLPAHRRQSAKGRPLKPLRIDFQPAVDSQSHNKPIARLKAAMVEGRLDHRRGELFLYGMRVLAAKKEGKSSEDQAAPA
jgi:hypothetical protein